MDGHPRMAFHGTVVRGNRFQHGWQRLVEQFALRGLEIRLFPHFAELVHDDLVIEPLLHPFQREHAGGDGKMRYGPIAKLLQVVEVVLVFE